MKRSIELSSSAASLAAFTIRTVCAVVLLIAVAAPVQAADVVVTLDLDLADNGNASGGGTWTLWGRIDDPSNGVDGTIGLAAVNAIINGIDFGTLGDAITIEAAGAIDPVPTSSGPRTPALDVGGGTIDIIYGQDITAAQSTGVGVNPGVGDALTDTLIASGTYSGAAPTFTTSGSSSTDANLLTASASPFTAAAPDSVSTAVVTLGDNTGEGLVTFADIQGFVDDVADGDGFSSDINQSGLVTFADIQPFVDLLAGASSASVAAVPEPSSLALLFLGSLAGLGRFGSRRS